MTAAALIIAFLLGSIPFGLMVSRVLRLPDPRHHGSGNTGATNVLRSGGAGAAAATLLLDGAKGMVAVLLAGMLADEWIMPWAALAACLGHCHSPWLGFRGGKGVATCLGALPVALGWPIFMTSLVTWLAVAGIWRISSLASLAMLMAMTTSVLLGKAPEEGKLPAAIAITLLIAWQHRSNMRRLLGGTEPRIGSDRETS